MSKQLENHLSTSLIETEAELEQVMTQPSAEVISALSTMDGDLMILGIGGKMGPTLARLAKRAIDEADMRKRVIGVSRFSNSKLVKDLNGGAIVAWQDSRKREGLFNVFLQRIDKNVGGFDF